MKVLENYSETAPRASKDWRPYLVDERVGKDTPPAWAGLCRGRGFSHTLAARVDDNMMGDVTALRDIVPGLSSSAAARLLLVFGSEALRASLEFAPGVVSDAVSPLDPASVNSPRLAASICPLVRNALRECASTCENSESGRTE